MKICLTQKNNDTLIDLSGHVGDINELVTSEDGTGIYLDWCLHEDGVVYEFWKHPQPISLIEHRIWELTNGKRQHLTMKDLQGMRFTIGLDYYQITKMKYQDNAIFVEGEWIGDVESGWDMEKGEAILTQRKGRGK